MSVVKLDRMARSPKRDVMTVAELADRLGISRNHAYAVCAAGELPVLRLGHKIVIPITRFEQWLAGEERNADR